MIDFGVKINFAKNHLMRIAMIGQKGLPAKYGGVERHVQELATRLAKQGHDVTVYGRSWYSQKEDGIVKGIYQKHTKGIKTKHLDAITHTFTATIDAIRSGYEIIHYHAVGPALLSWIPRLFAPKTKIITTFHCVDRYHQKWNWFARFMLRFGELATCRFAHKTIVVSQTLKQYCLNEFKSDTIYIPNGVNKPEDFIRDNILQEFGLEKNKYIVMISRLVPHKGAHLLVEAFINLKKRHKADPVIQDLKLAIVGGSSYTDDYVRSLHNTAGKTNHVVFTDFQSGETLKQLFAHSFVHIHPSMNEGLPITVLEAMVHKKPVLVSNIPEHLELIHDERMTFVENDVSAIEVAIYDFLNMPEEERSIIAKENQKVALDKHNWDKIVADLLEVYQSDASKDIKIAEASQASA